MVDELSDEVTLSELVVEVGSLFLDEVVFVGGSLVVSAAVEDEEEVVGSAEVVVGASEEDEEEEEVVDEVVESAEVVGSDDELGVSLVALPTRSVTSRP